MAIELSLLSLCCRLAVAVRIKNYASPLRKFLEFVNWDRWQCVVTHVAALLAATAVGVLGQDALTPPTPLEA